MHKRIAFLLSIGLILSACFPAVFVRKSIDDATVAAQARHNKPIQWQTGLGVSVIEDLRLLDDRRMLLMLKNDDDFLSNGDILLLDRNDGKHLWRYSRDRRNGDYSLVLATDHDLIFRIDRQDRSQLVAIDIGSGQERWVKDFTSAMQLLPMPGAASLLAVERAERSARLHAISPFDGRVRWQKQFRYSGEPARPVVSASAVWVFFDGVEKLRGSDGRRVWHKSGVQVAADAPPPQLAGKVLYIMDRKRHLLGLAQHSGATQLDVAISEDYRITNIYPLGRRLYLRGVVRGEPEDNLSVEERVRRAVQKSVARTMGLSGADGNDHVLLALSDKTGRTQWTSVLNEPSVSNLIEYGDMLYHATASRLIALDRKTGKQRFLRLVTNAGRDYPVHIRLVDNNLVYLGEWIVAAFDRRNGAQRYVQGMNPVPDSRATMAGLDETIDQLRSELEASAQPDTSIAAAIGEDARRFQNMANHYHSLATHYRSMSRSSSGSISESYYWKSLQSQNQAQIDSAFSSAYSTIATTVAIWELNAAMENAFHQSNLKSAIADAMLFRKAILGGFTRFENRDYYYRPHDDLNGFVGVAIVNLHTGKRSNIMISPGYQDYGLWNLVDLEHGVVYHHGIGLDPGSHHFVEQSRGMNTFMVYESYLIAQPIKLP